MGAEEIVPEQQKPVKDQIREQKRSVDRSKRALEREYKKLERERKKMLTQIKKMAEKGQTTGARMLAKDIVRCKTQMTKLEQFIGQLNAVSLRIGSCSSLNELGDAMTNCANAMTLVSSKLDAKKLAQMGKQMAKQDMMLEMKSDMMSDVLDSLDEGNEEAEEELYKQVLMEAGVSMQNELDVGLGGEKKENVQAKPMTDNIQSGVDDLDQMLKDLNKK
jgi:charged multivesicular body protein 2A